MAPERRLIPEETFDDPSSSSGTSSSSLVRCSSNVVGVIPPRIHEILSSSLSASSSNSNSSATHNNNSNNTRNKSPRGRVDDHASGVSFLLGRGRRDSSTVSLWTHATHTLNEELTPPSGPCVTLIHPEHHLPVDNDDDDVHGNDDDNDDDVLLVACLGPNANNSIDDVGRQRVTADRGRASSRHVYAASPATGVLCVWVLDFRSNSSQSSSSSSSSRGGVNANAGSEDVIAPPTASSSSKKSPECDASVRLPLRPGETLTALTPHVGGGESWLLAATSAGRLWKIYKTSRPLTLHAKMVEDDSIVGFAGGRRIGRAMRTEEEEEGTGIVRGLYNYFTTPSKPKSIRRDEEEKEYDGGGSDADLASDARERIAALIPMPSTTSSSDDGEGNGADDIGGQTAIPRSPVRRTGHRGPPRKQPRIAAAASARPPSCARALSLTSSLVLSEWKISLSENGEADLLRDGGREGRVSESHLLPRRDDGTLDLSCLRAASSQNETEAATGNDDDDDDLTGYRAADLLAPPSLSPDGRSLIVVLRVQRGSSDDADAARAYVARVVGLGSTVDEGGEGAPRIADAAWLDRHAGRSISSIGGTLECAGLSTAEAEEEEEEEERVSKGGYGSAAAYVAFGPRGDAAGSAVIVSAVHFSSSSAGGPPRRRPRVKDMDLRSNVVPSVVKGSVSYDSLTGGCVFLAASGLLAGASVRFPPDRAPPTLGEGRTAPATGTGSGSSDPSDESLARDEAVLTIKSHLQSAFRQHLVRSRRGGGGGGADRYDPAACLRASIPPSIATCASRVLSAAAVLASEDYVRAKASSGKGGGGRNTPRRSSSTSGLSPEPAASPVTALRDKRRTHEDFVNFLAHAGAYRRVSTAGRTKLRDHGEMIVAAKALLVDCQSRFANADAAVARDDDERRSELARAREIVAAAVEGVSDDVLVALPRSWARLQRQFSQNNEDDVRPSPLERDLILLASSSLCAGIGQALRYRQNESGSLYDVPSHADDRSSSRGSPWTSSPEMLEVLLAQLRAIRRAGDALLPDENEDANDDLRRHVEDISAAALAGHRDAASRDPDDDAVLRAYEEAKSLAVPLLRRYANDNDNGDDLLALRTALAHSHFEGVVGICHDHRRSWKFRGPFCDREADGTYDVRIMLGNSAAGSPYAHLHRGRDYRTGLPFCGYVLRWYADRGLYPDVFELGQSCPHDLTRYVRNDDRMSDLAWIQELRVGGDQQAVAGLLGLDSPVLFGDKKEGAVGIWEKDQLTSLAKLSNKLASAKTARVDPRRNALIENTLTLVSAQKILQEDTEVGDEIALGEGDLLRLATEKIDAARDADEVKRYGMCGLAVASAKPPERSDAMADDASSIWTAVIRADIHAWKGCAEEDGTAVGGISEEELIRRVEGTAFVGIVYDLVSASVAQEKMQSVGFLQDEVRNRVLHSLGSDELARVLTLSAEIASAA